jgi:hypothetical protein
MQIACTLTSLLRQTSQGMGFIPSDANTSARNVKTLQISFFKPIKYQIT